MPGRRKKLYTKGVYHVFNKTIDSSHIFKSDFNCNLFLEIVRYYRSSKSRVSFSHLKNLSSDLRRQIFLQTAIEKYFRIKLLAFCLMPTHYHMLIHQIEDFGISKFISNVTNSFTRHLNLKNDRLGPIFLTKFRAVPIMNDQQLIHVSRYIHLNPYSNGLVLDVNELPNYQWSSYPEYLALKPNLCDIKPVISLFGENNDRYQQFVTNNADYQRSLEYIKHVEKWI